MSESHKQLTTLGKPSCSVLNLFCGTDLGDVAVFCSEDDTIGDLKKLVAAQTGTRPEKIRIQKWYTIYKVFSICE